MAKTQTKNTKHNRNKVWCTGYALVNRRLRNKIRKIERHLKRLPGDKQSRRALGGLT